MTLTGMLFNQGQHVKRQRHSAALAMLFTLAAVVWSLVGVQGANASVDYGPAALNWAESHALGHWYLWGGTGPSYDCSGLIMVSYEHEGIYLPHNTVAMLYSGHLVRTYHPIRGDLAFYGTGHVEFVTSQYHMTFGAHDSGTRIGWIRYGGYWAPTAYYRVVR